MLQVVAGFIRKGNRVLLCQRPRKKARGLLWEFPGGKVEAGETLCQALLREGREELGVTLLPQHILTEVTYAYPDVTVHLTLILADLAGQEPKQLEHEAFFWADCTALSDIPLCPADQQMLKQLEPLLPQLLLQAGTGEAQSWTGQNNEALLVLSSWPKDGVSSHALLRKAALLYRGKQAENWSIAQDSQGKPYFPEVENVHFNITHSGDYWLCAFFSEPVGIDLQIHDHCQKERLSKRFFHPNEDRFLQTKNYAPFFDLWAAKESYMKYTGQGLALGLDAFSVVNEKGNFPLLSGVTLQLLSCLEGYSLCLCTKHPCQVRLTSLMNELSGI